MKRKDFQHRPADDLPIEKSKNLLWQKLERDARPKRLGLFNPFALKRLASMGVVAVLIIVAGLVGPNFSQTPRTQAQFELTPNEKNLDHLELGTSFTLKTPDAYDVEFIAKELVRIEPAIGFSVSEIKGRSNEYLIVLEQEPVKDQSYTFTIGQSSSPEESASPERSPREPKVAQVKSFQWTNSEETNDEIEEVPYEERTIVTEIFPEENFNEDPPHADPVVTEADTVEDYPFVYQSSGCLASLTIDYTVDPYGSFNMTGLDDSTVYVSSNGVATQGGTRNTYFIDTGARVSDIEGGFTAYVRAGATLEYTGNNGIIYYEPGAIIENYGTGMTFYKCSEIEQNFTFEGGEDLAENHGSLCTHELYAMPYAASIGEIVRGNLCASAVITADRFFVDVPEGKQLVVQLTNDDEEERLRVYSNGESDSVGPGDTVMISFIAEETGIYEVGVENTTTGQKQVPYRIEFMLLR